MLILGISNKIDREHSLFFYEFDNINYNYVLEESKFLSEVFNIDLFILESSENNYHLISFDILTNEKVLEIQNWVSLKSDYVVLDEQKLFGNQFENNCLRLSEKGKKGIPIFKGFVLAKHNPHTASFTIFRFYKQMFKFPEEIEYKYNEKQSFKMIETNIFFFSYITKKYIKETKLKRYGKRLKK